jgi:putative intracellular protease/amidase
VAPHDPAKPTAVVVLGALGAEGADVLAPYEVLAATGRFNLYTVGPARRPVPLIGGLDLMPDLTFDELTGRLGGAVPDLVVVPQLADTGEPTSAPVTDWLRGQAARGTQLLSICTDAGVLASADLLDGHPATAHWLRLPGLESRYPDVQWVRGQRVVDDGDIVSTAGILSGIDGTLHVVERFFGAGVAADAAAAVGWQHYGTGAPAPVTLGSSLPDPVAIVNAGYRWNPATIGVVLTEGVGEIELVSVFDTHAWSLGHPHACRHRRRRPGALPARADLPASRRPGDPGARPSARARRRRGRHPSGRAAGGRRPDPGVRAQSAGLRVRRHHPRPGPHHRRRHRRMDGEGARAAHRRPRPRRTSLALGPHRPSRRRRPAGRVRPRRSDPVAQAAVTGNDDWRSRREDGPMQINRVRSRRRRGPTGS